MIDDIKLLRRYATEGDQNAFSEVVRRNLPFVYSAALRRLGRDAHHAQDVAQVVFCALARNAKRIARYPALGGWLYTATRNAVIDAIRAEKRRRTREEEACHMQQMEAEPDAPADWSQLRPVLDLAMDRLGAPDREAVLLRFFQGRSFAEIGTAVGLSEDAARKRVDRALARLRDLLQRHGIASTATALGALLANQAVSAAPATLLADVTRAALATGTTTTTGVFTFLTMTKLQAGVAAAVIAGSVGGLIVQQRTIASLRAEVAAAEARFIGSAGANTRAGKPIGAATTQQSRLRDVVTAGADPATQPPARGELLAETNAALRHGKVPERYFAMVSVLRKLSPGNWREVEQAFEDERKRTGLGHPEVYEIFVRRAGEVAGRDVVSAFLRRGWAGDAREAMIGWASQDPVQALRWLGRDVDPETRRSLMGSVIRGLALSEPDLAIKTLEDQPVMERYRYAEELVTSMLRTVGIEGVQRLVEGMISRAADAGHLREEYLKFVFSDYSLKRIAQSAAAGTIGDTASWLTRHIGQSYVDHRVIAEVAGELARQNPAETFRWLEGVNSALLRAGDDSTAGYRVFLAAWAKKEGPQVVETWLQGQQSHPHYDHIAWQYAALTANQDPKKATDWSNTIKDQKIRQSVLQSINKRLPKE